MAKIPQYLLANGFNHGGFRCVWHRSTGSTFSSDLDGISIRCFGSNELDDFLRETAKVRSEDVSDGLIHDTKFGQIGKEWRHYIGYYGDKPCAIAVMYDDKRTAYFEWAYTVKSYRRKGFHTAMIRRRAKDASESGCAHLFTVTDFDNQSSRDLQREGFTLAYNYIMYIGNPMRLGSHNKTP